MNEISQAEADRMRPMVAHVLEGEPLPSVKPTPSITVGTQVRLTGVVISQARNGTVHIKLFGVHCEITVNAEETHHLEVTRQPFKRGEVVYRDDTKYVTVEDEEGGSVKLTTAFIGAEVFLAVASDFERRP